MSAERLPRVEWDFDDVSDKELIACCLWEYARESLFMRKGVEGLRNEGSRSVKEENERFLDILFHPSGMFLLDVLFLGIVPNCVTKGDMRPSSFPAPWQTIPEKERKARSHPMLPVHIHTPFRRAHWAKAISLAREAEARANDWRVKHPKSLGPPFHASMIVSGREIAAFEINWKEFSNAKIKAAFAEWVDHKQRPKTIPEPADGAGHKLIDWRKKLRDLGVMRLMNFSTVAGMRTRCPEAAQAFGHWETKHWCAARKRALKNFRELLPFLPQSELPIHAGTKGGRAKL